jgi:MerR family transcriptional regulator, mercuric resistance operon regulatory protein
MGLLAYVEGSGCLLFDDAQAQDRVCTVVQSQGESMNPVRLQMSIGQLAKAGGVGVETVRYYQRRGLLPKPERPAGGFRHYSAAALEQLRSVKRAQQAGFSLAEIAVLLRLDRVRDRQAAQRLAARKVAEIDQQIDVLQKLRHALRGLTLACERGVGDVPCPILDAFRPPSRGR